MNWRRISAIAQKDLSEVTASSQVMVPMAIVPIVMCVAVPAVVLLLGLNMGADALGNMGFLSKLVARYPVPVAITGTLDRMLYVFLNYTFLPFFMIIPVLVSSIIAANSVVGEKERGTLETLLYTPVTNRELVVAKLLSSFVPAIIVTFGGFAGYFLLSNGIFWAYRGTLIIRDVIWLPALLLLAPAVSLLGLSAALLVSMKAKTYMEAQQMSALVVVPFVVLLYGQIGGLFVLGPLMVVLLGVAALGISYVLYGRIGPRFNREQMLMNM
jgi:ABC-type transport system involved in multi-copper enzyme maturation permease subunit